MGTGDADRIFVDTNVLLAATDRDRARHGEATRFFESAFRGEFRAFFTGQILREYLVVATRSVEVNGLGLEISQARDNVGTFQQAARLLPEDNETVRLLSDLVGRYRIQGKSIHDTNLVASMLQHGLRKLKTFNPRDFERFEEVDVVRE